MTGQQPAEAFGRFYGVRDRDNPAARRMQRSQRGIAWDPWPVKNFRGDTTFEAAKKLIQPRDVQCVNICTDKIVLLPASGSISGVQGGSNELPLYSLRSPDKLPVRFHMWEIPAVWKWHDKALFWSVCRPKKLMVRHGQRTEPLTHFLQSFGVSKMDAKECDLCNHFCCWKGLSMNDKYLNEFPEHLRDPIYKKWWNINGFRFLELPPELREAILELALGSVFEPFKHLRQNNCIGQLKGSCLATGPNMHLALVSRQLNQEMMPVLFVKTTFVLRDAVHFNSFIRHIDIRIRKDLPTSFERLCSIELCLDARNLLRLVNLGTHRKDLRYRYEEWLGESFPLFRQMCLKNPALRRIGIKFPHVSQLRQHDFLNLCQKTLCLAFWAGARSSLRHVSRVKLHGHIDKVQKQEWLEEHALERKGIIPEQGDLVEWQKRIWHQWYVSLIVSFV